MPSGPSITHPSNGGAPPEKPYHRLTAEAGASETLTLSPFHSLPRPLPRFRSTTALSLVLSATAPFSPSPGAYSLPQAFPLLSSAPQPLLFDLTQRIDQRPPQPRRREAPPPSDHGVAAGLLAGARVRASKRGVPSSWPDRGALVACLGFAVALLHTCHGSPATWSLPTRASEAVVHLALQVTVVVFARVPRGSQAVGQPDLKVGSAAAGVTAPFPSI